MPDTPEANSIGGKLKSAFRAGLFGKSHPSPATTPSTISANLDAPLIPASLNEVIEMIPPQVPDVFKQQARVAASYIARLDRGDSLTDPKMRVFVDQLANTGFRYMVYINSTLSWLKESADPKAALPSWLQNDWLIANHVFRGKALAEADRPRIQTLFDRWVKTQSMNYRTKPNGTYFALDSSPSNVPITRGFKCYVEGADLLEALEQEKFPALFTDLKYLGVNPDEMKLFEEDRLVLYYSKDITVAERIRESFNKRGIHFRGPAQDVNEINIDEKGSLIIEDVTSNDGSLGEGGHTPIDYKVQRYKPEEFLDNYLQLCLWAGKDPSEPYKTSFVYFEDYEGRAKRNLPALVKKASEMVQYPILYTAHRLDVARK